MTLTARRVWLRIACGAGRVSTWRCERRCRDRNATHSFRWRAPRGRQAVHPSIQQYHLKQQQHHHIVIVRTSRHYLSQYHFWWTVYMMAHTCTMYVYVHVHKHVHSTYLLQRKRHAQGRNRSLQSHTTHEILSSKQTGRQTQVYYYYYLCVIKAKIHVHVHICTWNTLPDIHERF